MRMTAALFSSAALTLGLGVAAIAAPQGMAPYPGQGAAAAPPPPGYLPNGAAPPTPAPKQVNCLWNRRIRNWSSVDEKSMIIHKGSRRYLVTFSGSCRESRFEQGLVIDRRHGMCLGPGDRVTFGSPAGRQWDHAAAPCYIKKIEELPGRA